MLRQNGFGATLTGDSGLFDSEYINEPFHKPDLIKQLVFITPHWSMHLDQAKELLQRFTVHYDNADRIVSLHSAPNDVDRELIDFAVQLGWKIHYTSHELENIAIYRESDLHVGYRFHGHLAHLRWRRPSVILAEDSRAQGLNETLGTSGFPAFESRRGLARKFGGIHDSFPFVGLSFVLEKYGYADLIPDRRKLAGLLNPTAIEDVLHFVEHQQSNGWQAFDHVQNVMDEIYTEGIRPCLESTLGPSRLAGQENGV